jgi:hypothetical protein
MTVHNVRVAIGLRGRPDPARPLVRTGVSVYRDTWAAVEEEARRRRCKVSAVLREIVDEWVRSRKQENAA